jgi:hypothetical protein
MTVLSPAQIAAHAQAAGFRGQALVTIVAIALAESGGNPAAKGDTTLTNATWGPSIGLWQVRSLKAQSGTGRERDAMRLTDPAFNARAAWTISKSGTTFQPWSVYTAGTYAAQLARAQAGVSGAGATSSTDGAALAVDQAGLLDVPGNVVNGVESIAKSFAVIGSTWIHSAQWIANPHNWSRVAFVVAGSAACLAGLVMLAQSGVGPTAPIAAGVDKAKALAKSGVNGAATVATGAATGGTSVVAGGAAKAAAVAKSTVK